MPSSYREMSMNKSPFLCVKDGIAGVNVDMNFGSSHRICAISECPSCWLVVKDFRNGNSFNDIDKAKLKLGWCGCSMLYLNTVWWHL